MIIPPQLGVGGCAPMPKKLKPLSINIAEAKLEAAITHNGAILFGKICLKSIRKSEKPNTFAASIYCIFLTLRVCPLTILATSTHIVSPTATNTCQYPFPKANVKAITNNKVGIDQVTFINHKMKASIFPP